MNSCNISENYNSPTRKFFLISAICGFLVLLGSLTDLIIGFALGGNLAALPHTAIDRFAQFNINPLLGLYNMDLLNLCTTLIMVAPVIVIYYIHRNMNCPLALFALIFFVIGTVVFITNNSALAMFNLSAEYAVANTDQNKLLLSAAGESLLARGAHGSLSVFVGFFLVSFSEILISILMLKGRVFSRANSLIGLIGISLLTVYTVLITFVPSIESYATAFAAPGGILAMIWIYMFSMKLLKLSCSKS